MVSETVLTVCPHCSAGCQVRLTTQGGRIVEVGAGPGGVSPGLICDRGRLGWDFVHAGERLTTPLVRDGGRLCPASWSEALDLVADRLKAIAAYHGAAAVGGLASGRCTNEENYLFQWVLRAGLGTNNIDSGLRYGAAAARAGLSRCLPGIGAGTNPLEDIAGAGTILVIGANLADNYPLIELKVRAALRQGARLIVIDPRRVGLTELSDLHLQPIPGSDVALLNGIIHVILAEGLADRAFVEGHTQGVADLEAVARRYSPALVEAVTGVPAGRVREAARLYAKGDKALTIFADGLAGHAAGADNAATVANLAMLTGQVGRASSGIYCLSGQANIQGACDMGALPDVFPGHQPVTDPRSRDRFEAVWDRQLNGLAGLTALEMFRAATTGHLCGLFVMGADPLNSAPDRAMVGAALGGLEFLVVQDIFLSETARVADVVLPGASIAEKSGTFTSIERRVQRVRAAVLPPGAARPDWEILLELGARLGLGGERTDPAAVFDEIAAVLPEYREISYPRLQAEPDGLHCIGSDGLTGRTLRFCGIDYRGPVELPDDEYPLLMVIGHSPGLAPGAVSIHPALAAEHGLDHGDPVRVVSRRGALTARAAPDPVLAPGMIYLSLHHAESPVNILTSSFFDPHAKSAELKVTVVRIERAWPAVALTSAAVGNGEQEPA